MIGIIDYGCGNVGSVLNMFSKIDIYSEKVSDPKLLNQYSALVLPGVGSFDTGVKQLKLSGFWDELANAVTINHVPILGICLGMQLFFEGSEEGFEKGFGFFPGIVRKFDSINRIPHMSWNEVNFKNEPYTILENKLFYFVHSYYAPIELEKQFVLGETEYGVTFPSVVHDGNIIGFQFHPEKSLKNGMELLRPRCNEF